MSTAALLRLQKLAHGKTKSLSLPAFHLPAKTLFWIVFFAMASLALLYVFQINQLTREYYFVSTSERTIHQLSQQNKQLQISVAENSLMEHMLSRASALDFQVANSVKYIHMPENSFAVAR